MAGSDVESSCPRLLLVANRLPITWAPTSGWGRAPGGLVTSLESVARRKQVTWFGSSASLGDDGGVAPTWPHGTIHQVRVEADLAARAVAGFSNSCLWPALHAIGNQVRWREGWWDAYRAFNARFAREVARTALLGDLVWVHDHHLLLVPEMLTVERPDLVVGLSLRTPVDATVLAGLPMTEALTEALTAPAVIGVQTQRDLAELAAFCPNRLGSVVVSPASIDPIELLELARSRATRALVERLRGSLGSRLLVVGVDRIDHTKALLQRIDAIDRAFRQGHLRPDDVEIIQIAQPSRTEQAAYRELRVEVERRAHDVSSRWVRSDGTPALRVITEGRDRRSVAALLSAADIALVTPARDGMNLVAKEFSIYNEQRGGVLVLGEGAGAADELGDASVLVDGSDSASIANGIARAVSLDESTRRIMARRRADAVRSWTSQHWASDFERRLLDTRVSDRHPIG